MQLPIRTRSSNNCPKISSNPAKVLRNEILAFPQTLIQETHPIMYCMSHLRNKKSSICCHFTFKLFD